MGLIMAFDLPHYSRYKDTNKIIYEGSETFGLYLRQDKLQSLKPEDLINVKVTPEFAGRPDQIANEYYNTPYYSWLIVMYSAPLNPIGWPKQGSTILIPKFDIVNDIIHG